MTKEELVLYRPEFLSLSEVATLMGITRTEVKALIRRDIIKQESSDKNTKRKVKFSAIENFIQI